MKLPVISPVDPTPVPAVPDGSSSVAKGTYAFAMVWTIAPLNREMESTDELA